MQGCLVVQQKRQNANLINRAYLVNMLTRLLSWSKIVKNMLTQLKYGPLSTSSDKVMNLKFQIYESFYQYLNNLYVNLIREGFSIQSLHPRTRPRTFLNCFVLNTISYKAKQLRNVLGCILGRKNQIQNWSFNQ